MVDRKTLVVLLVFCLAMVGVAGVTIYLGESAFREPETVIDNSDPGFRQIEVTPVPAPEPDESKGSLAPPPEPAPVSSGTYPGKH